MTKSKPNKKENKSKTSEEPTHRKPQQEVLFFLKNMGGGYWWLELSWCLDGHCSFHPNPSELGRLCSFEDVNSLLFIFKCFESTL
ncbi:unnamed protein product [Brassica oleracea]